MPFIRSDDVVDLWGHKILVPQGQIYQHAIRVISVQAKQVRLVSRHGMVARTSPVGADRQLE